MPMSTTPIKDIINMKPSVKKAPPGLGRQVENLSDGELSDSSAVERPSPASATQKLLDKTANAPITAPRTLGGFRYVPYGIQILLTIFPILFIVLASTAMSLNGKPTSNTGRAVQQAITLSPTIFPIVFAAIVGKFLRTVGLFQAERGIKLATLERLIGSQSLFAAIERQLTLGGRNVLGIIIILLWALSPLGGQSALRLLQVSPRIVSVNTVVRYLPIVPSKFSAMVAATPGSYDWPSYASLYMTALITSAKQQNSAQDLFGNVRIPSVGQFASSLPANNGSWMTLDHNQDIYYSSMLGIPVVGVPVSGNLSFNIISRYQAIDCPIIRHEPNSTLFTTSATFGQRTATFTVQPELPSPPQPSVIRSLPFSLISQNSAAGTDISVMNCSMSPRDVESSVSCIDQLCQVTAMRNLTVDGLGFWDWVPISNALDYLPDTTIGWGNPELPGQVGSGLTEMWLQDPGASYSTRGSGPGGENEYSNLSQLSPSTLSRNLEVLLNTYWQSTYASTYIFGNLSTNLSRYDNIPNIWQADGSSFSFNTSQVTIESREGEQYESNETFIIILILFSVILFLLGVASLLTMSITLAPDILGYVSSHTRDNPYVDDSDQASYLNGLERAKAMKDARVILGDANIAGDMGYIVFTTAQIAESRRLRKHRLYK